jgi:hypothetical protein
MSEQTMGQTSLLRGSGVGMDGGGRRGQLRALLLSAADTARQGRRLALDGQADARRMGRAIRDRISMLLSAAG